MITLARRERFVLYIMLGPAILGLLLFKVWPIVVAFWQSTLSFDFRRQATVFVGLRNYLEILSDPIVWDSAKVTLVFNLIINPLQVVLSFALALLVARPVRGIGMYRSLLMAPIATSITVTSLLWGLILNPSFGLANGLLSKLGIPPQPFLTSPSQALASIILLATWRGVGYWMIFFLAGLNEIPRTVFEAAAIDGAGRWSMLRYITIPLLKPVFAFVLVADTAVNFLMFAPPYVLTSGGPMGSTNLLMYEAYTRAFTYLDMGHGTALTSLLILIVLAIVLVQLRILRTQSGD